MFAMQTAPTQTESEFARRKPMTNGEDTLKARRAARRLAAAKAARATDLANTGFDQGAAQVSVSMPVGKVMNVREIFGSTSTDSGVSTVSERSACSTACEVKSERQSIQLCGLVADTRKTSFSLVDVIPPRSSTMTAGPPGMPDEPRRTRFHDCVETFDRNSRSTRVCHSIREERTSEGQTMEGVKDSVSRSPTITELDPRQSKTSAVSRPPPGLVHPDDEVAVVSGPLHPDDAPPGLVHPANMGPKTRGSSPPGFHPTGIQPSLSQSPPGFQLPSPPGYQPPSPPGFKSMSLVDTIRADPQKRTIEMTQSSELSMQQFARAAIIDSRMKELAGNLKSPAQVSSFDDRKRLEMMYNAHRLLELERDRNPQIAKQLSQKIKKYSFQG